MKHYGAVAALLAVAILAGCSPSPVAHDKPSSMAMGPSPKPTYDPDRVSLGWTWNQDVAGFGTVRPSTIGNGGDPTGWVDKVKWKSWGTPVATAAGIGTWVPANKAVADGVQRPVVVVAWNIGPCHGLIAYRSVGWYFPTEGEHFDPLNSVDSYNLCVDQAKLPDWEL
jgi:hypothetical protein